MNANRQRIKIKKMSASICVSLWLISLVLFSACNQLEKPKTEPFYSQTAPPPKQEFRWSNGKTPKSFDPALAAASPETDVVRAIFDGLTETEAKTLQAVPAVAKDWKSSDENKTWTFNLRKDARWSNGETVKAQDFVRSWKRLAELGEKAAHYELLSNIVGMKVPARENSPEKEAGQLNVLSKKPITEDLQLFPKQSESNSTTALQSNVNKSPESGKNVAAPVKNEPKLTIEEKTEVKFGAEAVDNFTLKVTLVKPDGDFPELVAHPIFRPIYGDEKQFESGKLNADIITNGAFRVFSVGQDGVTLDRAEHYWNSEAIKLERVRFVPTESAEKALEAYRAGEIDAVTNADFAPLALKLLTPFDDFRLTAHSALNFYEINSSRKPFDDRRVREAMALAIERERLTEDDMDGASVPALNFLPFDKEKDEKKFTQDPIRAKNLLKEAGFPDGENFPTLRLLVNRNNVQQQIARSVAKMWKRNLNIETEIAVKDSAELEIAEQAGDFDVIRRGVVLATTDEAANLAVIFNSREKLKSADAAKSADVLKGEETNKIIESSELATVAAEPVEQPKVSSESQSASENKVIENVETGDKQKLILTEEEAVNQIRAIPLYFPTSYSLVKPYVTGFEINILDAPSLKDVRINNNWQPKSGSVEP